MTILAASQRGGGLGKFAQSELWASSKVPLQEGTGHHATCRRDVRPRTRCVQAG